MGGLIYPDTATRDFKRFFEHVKKNGFNPKTVIDAGAAKGTPSLHQAFPDAYFYLFEPVQEFIPELKDVPIGQIHQPKDDLFSSADYPAPILDLKESRLRAIQAFKDAREEVNA